LVAFESIETEFNTALAEIENSAQDMEMNQAA